MKHDRQLLLHGAKRNEVLDLAEVQAYGRDSYGDPEYVRLYGLRPAEWYAQGIRLLGRTAVECTRDEFADLIGRDVAAVAARWHSPHRPLLVDPFAGSGNTLFWLARHLAVDKGIGFELDPGVFGLTAKNLQTLGLPIELRNVDYRDALPALRHASSFSTMLTASPRSSRPYQPFTPALAKPPRRSHAAPPHRGSRSASRSSGSVPCPPAA